MYALCFMTCTSCTEALGFLTAPCGVMLGPILCTAVCARTLWLSCRGLVITFTLPHMLQGTIEGYEHSYALDDNHVFERGRPQLVCGNTAAVLGEGGLSHLAKHFQVNFTSDSGELFTAM